MLTEIRTAQDTQTRNQQNVKLGTISRQMLARAYGEDEA